MRALVTVCAHSQNNTNWVFGAATKPEKKAGRKKEKSAMHNLPICQMQMKPFKSDAPVCHQAQAALEWFILHIAANGFLKDFYLYLFLFSFLSFLYRVA